jgi:hypothetical protein
MNRRRKFTFPERVRAAYIKVSTGLGLVATIEGGEGGRSLVKMIAGRANAMLVM